MRLEAALLCAAAGSVAWAIPQWQDRRPDSNSTIPTLNSRQSISERCQLDLGNLTPKQVVVDNTNRRIALNIRIVMYFHVIARSTKREDGWVSVSATTIPSSRISCSSQGARVSDPSTNSGYQDAELEAQYKAIVAGYERTGITFDWKRDKTTRTVQPSWTQFPEGFGDIESPVPQWEIDWKSKLRQGGNDLKVLNVYFNPGISGGISVLIADERQKANYIVHDGCIINPNTMVGGVTGFDQGKTAVHEIGHWLGLYHTFQGGCGSLGDQVADTPPARYSSDMGQPACDDTQNTCPDTLGPGGTDAPDPNHNYMSYAPDSCMDNFTNGQL